MMPKSRKIIDAIEKAVREIYGLSKGYIPLHSPVIGQNEMDYVKKCLEEGWVSSAGGYVGKFERAVSEFTKAKYAIATVSGTAAIHTALRLGGVQTNEEVLCPAFSFVGTVNPIIYLGAHPVFIDSDHRTLGVDVSKVNRFLRDRCKREKDGFTYNKRSGKKIKACIPVHAYGYPVDMEPLLNLCEENKITVIEDAAEAMGSHYKKQHCGTLGKMGALSFNGNKVITTGGGGMVLTDDHELAERVKHITTTARGNHPWEYIHDVVGYNYRMPNINAALGCAQLEALPDFLVKKQRQAKRLKTYLEDSEEIKIIQPNTENVNHWFNLIKIDPDNRDAILKGLNEKGIQARSSWTPLCDMPPYERYERFEIEAARDLHRSIICIPNGLLK